MILSFVLRKTTVNVTARRAFRNRFFSKQPGIQYFFILPQIWHSFSFIFYYSVLNFANIGCQEATNGPNLPPPNQILMAANMVKAILLSLRSICLMSIYTLSHQMQLVEPKRPSDMPQDSPSHFCRNWSCDGLGPPVLLKQFVSDFETMEPEAFGNKHDDHMYI